MRSVCYLYGSKYLKSSIHESSHSSIYSTALQPSYDRQIFCSCSKCARLRVSRQRRSMGRPQSSYPLPTGSDMSELLRGADALLKFAGFLSQLVMVSYASPRQPSNIAPHRICPNCIDKLSLTDRKSTRLNSSHSGESRMPSSA